MSTDLDLNLNFHVTAIIDRKKSSVVVAGKVKDQVNVLKEINEGAEENPLTPTLEENKIPAPRSPPPAPRKRRCGVVIACRKKLDFLEQHPQLIIPKEDVIQEFFNSSFDQIHSRRLLKRRCPCI